MPDRAREPWLLADFGSTYTKVTAVDAADGRLLARARSRTTVGTDVFDGFLAARAQLKEAVPGLEDAPVRACSSAGGGLRMVVLGLERELTAEAARQAALSAGARVTGVIAGRLNGGLDRLLADPPDLLLLTGGTDGGNATWLLEAADRLAASPLDAPIVVAGNRAAQKQALATLERADKRVWAAPNVLPEIGALRERPVRRILREVFARHVIGGKRLSRRPEFHAAVRLATPDAVLAAAELLSRGTDARGGVGPLLVLDVGGATTDAHSVRGRSASRSVEGDLGLRWNATGILEGARAAGVLADGEAERLAAAAARRAADVAFVPASPESWRDEVDLLAAAARLAVLRHAGTLRVRVERDGTSVRRDGPDCRSVRTVVATGGVFEHAREADLELLLRRSWAPVPRRLLPHAPRVAIDRCQLLAAAGVLALERPRSALALLRREVLPDA